ncbi:MAG: hypothetical protein HND43_11185 [Armatimonadetes bacterium]|nr:hypothetical protein [Armatimonadota bacterium]
MSITAGQWVTIEYVEGTWRAGALPTWPLVGPQGDPQVSGKASFPVPSAWIMSLVGGIGSYQPFFVGTSITFQSSVSGTLWLGANDDGFSDNHGSLTVRITVSATATPPPSATATTRALLAVSATRPASADEARQYPSIWSGLTLVNLEAPGMQTYFQTIEPMPYRWAFSWCGRDASHLQEILRPFSVDFYFNDTRIDPTALLQFDSGGTCRNWLTVLDNWPSSGQVTLDVRYHLSEAIMGGTGIRSPGDYVQRIHVTVYDPSSAQPGHPLVVTARPTELPLPTPVRLSLETSRPASREAARAVNSIWEGVKFIDAQSPGMQTYHKTVNRELVNWTFLWCGNSPDNLREILQPLTVRFFIDDVELESSDILQYERDNCHAWVTFLDGWRSGQSVTLDIRYTLHDSVHDGKSLYRAGDYIQQLLVTVR